MATVLVYRSADSTGAPEDANAPEPMEHRAPTAVSQASDRAVRLESTMSISSLQLAADANGGMIDPINADEFDADACYVSSSQICNTQLVFTQPAATQRL